MNFCEEFWVISAVSIMYNCFIDEIFFPCWTLQWSPFKYLFLVYLFLSINQKTNIANTHKTGCCISLRWFTGRPYPAPIQATMSRRLTLKVIIPQKDIMLLINNLITVPVSKQRPSVRAKQQNVSKITKCTFVFTVKYINECQGYRLHFAKNYATGE